MFSGIVQDLGTVRTIEQRGGDARMVIAAAQLDLQALRVGDSMCVQGACLTIAECAHDAFAVDVSRETLAVTTLGSFAAGRKVNLEPALRAGDPLGGHLVSGHVDGIGRVAALQPDARSMRVTVQAPRELAKYLARKGSVALDGVSLTVNVSRDSMFETNLIPHTRTVTTLGELAVGDPVNLEIDQVARYLEHLLSATR
jgi:riboflavin synthase